MSDTDDLPREEIEARMSAGLKRALAPAKAATSAASPRPSARPVSPAAEREAHIHEHIARLDVEGLSKPVNPEECCQHLCDEAEHSSNDADEPARPEQQDCDDHQQ